MRGRARHARGPPRRSGRARTAGARLVERNIEDDEDWQRRYAFTIPVVTVGDVELELATSPAKLRRLLAEGLDGANEANEVVDADGVGR